MSSTSVMAAAGLAVSTPHGPTTNVSNFRISNSGTSRGPVIDVFNFSGGRSQTYR
jgi:hypothetical protein